MIGNDVIDLEWAKQESNWQRKGFLDKIFTQQEQVFIKNASQPFVAVWDLWSRKEAAYKVYNRETGIKGYFPWQLHCVFDTPTSGFVYIQGKKYFTQTEVSKQKIHTIAVTEQSLFCQIQKLDAAALIIKKAGIPFLYDKNTQIAHVVSISHHGRFWEGIQLLS